MKVILKNREIFVILLVALLIITNCKTEIPVTGVSLTDTYIYFAGYGCYMNEQFLYAKIQPDNATNKSVTWSSDNKDIVKVNDRGEVNAFALGRANITVTTNDGGYEATCKVIINHFEPWLIRIKTGSSYVRFKIAGYSEFKFDRSNKSYSLSVYDEDDWNSSENWEKYEFIHEFPSTFEKDIFVVTVVEDKCIFLNDYNITHLDCSGNKITELQITLFTTLQYLDCDVNLLKKIDLSENEDLKYLYCAQNKLTSLDLSNNTSLIQLSVLSNQLSKSALNDLFKTLHDNNIEGKTIYIGGNPGTADCDRSIAEKKGWAVVD